MFNDAGSKLQIFAKVLCAISCVMSWLFALLLLGYNLGLFIVFLIVVPLMSYISSLFIVSFGQLVEDTHIIRENIKK